MSSTYITVGATSISIELPDDVWYSTTHSAPYCILVDLGSICYVTCPLLDVPADQTIPVTIDIDYTPPNFVCGVKPAPIEDFKVADIYGCMPVEEPPQSYYLILYFPYFAPVNDPGDQLVLRRGRDQLRGRSHQRRHLLLLGRGWRRVLRRNVPDGRT